MSLPKPYEDTVILSASSKVYMTVPATYLGTQEPLLPDNRPINSFSSVLSPQRIRLENPYK